ncbi:NAD-dependent epimerase/dehydratase family protein [Pseudoalteromonas sp. R3]|uniref:NAD-dependent epimerase/dehydratase family protein n=1 Tax=Pseudoalteromonas sp. R3 TaxID=1709477 RepID=UPI0006B473C8|nr:NAD-dependent epimerase/dehydratase family protein [Pseudoalteromonas sp. R3]AZZ99564.1 NAD-dependent epimerase/dehydratase family protein [Pseudoalteromonas sp. R3]
MKVIITGAAGFIGEHLRKFLSDNNFEIIPIVRNKAIPDCQDNKCLTYEEFYQLDKNDLPDVEAVIHLAGAAHKAFSDEDAKQANETLTQSIVSKSKSLGVKRFVFISSVGLYQEQPGKIDLKTTPTNTKKNTNYYKLEAESIVKNGFSDCSTDYVILRLPLVYGEGVKANFAALMNLVGKGLPLPFRGINSNKRSLISVYNLVDLIKVCIGHPKASNQVFLASDDHDLSTAEMIALMAKVQGKKNCSIYIPALLFKMFGKVLGKKDMVDRLTGSLHVDITHTKHTLEWQPPYSVEHGFRLAAK